jgi:NAD(P)H-hydrate epimerase
MEIKFTREEMRALDAIAIEKYAIPGIVLMENAALKTFLEIQRMIAPGKIVGVVCGRGNNGGDGYAIARHLYNAGFPTRVFGLNIRQYLNPENPSPDDAVKNLQILTNMSVPIKEIGTDVTIDGLEAEFSKCHLLVDALLGTGLTGPARPPISNIIDALNAANKQVVAVDIPSGLDCDTGEAPGSCVKATKTVTFGAPKVGFFTENAKKFLGELVVADISIPRTLLRHYYLQRHHEELADKLEDFVNETLGPVRGDDE